MSAADAAAQSRGKIGIVPWPQGDRAFFLADDPARVEFPHGPGAWLSVGGLSIRTRQYGEFRRVRNNARMTPRNFVIAGLQLAPGHQINCRHVVTGAVNVYERLAAAFPDAR